MGGPTASHPPNGNSLSNSCSKIASSSSSTNNSSNYHRSSTAVDGKSPCQPWHPLRATSGCPKLPGTGSAILPVAWQGLRAQRLSVPRWCIETIHFIPRTDDSQCGRAAFVVGRLFPLLERSSTGRCSVPSACRCLIMLVCWP